ncbi:MAG: hypothetical protein WCK35_08145 [Chloroflexota bacterium]
MQVGTVQKLISIFNQSFRELGVVVSLEKLETLSVTIHRAMTVQARHFHTLEHVFNFVTPNNAIVSLAALYHDIVYYQVDMGFSPQIRELISPYIHQVGDEFFVAGFIPKTDRIFFLTLDIFDLQPGQLLSSVAALNEFLSALVMNKQLSGLVSEKDLTFMTICIEATIPFRGISSDGKNHFDLLEMRLPKVIMDYDLGIGQQELIDGIKTAVLFANKDIENFAETDSGRFLDNTWKLLPETNAALRLPDVYTMGAYRDALQKMKGFFDNLDADMVFSQYCNAPPSEEYSQMTRLARNNIQVARQYLGIKILGTTILEALALATGGDAPLSLFMGDVPREGITIKRLEYFLPELEDPSWVDHNSTIYQLLESGRASDTSFDMKNSPLSLFVYKSIAPEKISLLLRRAQDFFSHRITADDYLKEIDQNVVQAIARACSIMVYTRRQALLRFAQEE